MIIAHIGPNGNPVSSEQQRTSISASPLESLLSQYWIEWHASRPELDRQYRLPFTISRMVRDGAFVGPTERLVVGIRKSGSAGW
jgi:hypothetical protein